MTDGEVIGHQRLLAQVAEQLSKIPSDTDHRMVTKWRVLSICQRLLGEPEKELEVAYLTVLNAFAAHGSSPEYDQAFETARSSINFTAETALTSISTGMRAAVSMHLGKLAHGGATTIERALRMLPVVRDRLNTTVCATTFPGIRHRFELVASLLECRTRAEGERLRAAAAVLYVDEVNDVIPDTLGVIGMLDDDYALRVVLEECAGSDKEPYLHWSERILSLWDELPFLKGVDLYRGNSPISVTWLDRVNSCISCSHVLGAQKEMLVLLQPSVACSPLHTLVSLLGVLLLDAVTSSQMKANALRVGQTYQLDEFVVRFDGIADSPFGWLRLQGRDCVLHQPQGVADRMVPIDARRLSSLGKFSSESSAAGADPIQRFFHWGAAIGPASISSRLILVTSRQRALNLLHGVQSNGVHLLDHSLVRFVGTVTEEIETFGSLLLVVPSLSTVRRILDRGVHIQAILIDGYERLHHGRHELPFLTNRREAPPMISWSATGYYPPAPPPWLLQHRCLKTSPQDLIDILELSDANTDLSQASLWEAATGIRLQTHVARALSIETAVLDAIDGYIRIVRASPALPEYWQYHLIAPAKTLKTLVASTPAEWSEIALFVSAWSSSTDERWLSLRPSVITALAELRNAEKALVKLICGVQDFVNSRATAIAALLADPAYADGHWYLVCDHPQQAKVAAAALETLRLRVIEPVLLRDLPVCSTCIVVGWLGFSFVRRLWAHTPRTIVALIDETDLLHWESAAESQRQPDGQSMLHALGRRSEPSFEGATPITVEDRAAGENINASQSKADMVPCVFLWVTGEFDAKILEPDGRVIVEEDNAAHERAAARLCPDDRVILGIGTSRWSPADEFTGAVIDAVKASHPELVKTAREWRQALRHLVEMQRLSTSALKGRLTALGVGREEQTLEGWLDLGRAAPIAPRGQEAELAAIWPVLEPYATHSLKDVCEACARLRNLRTASSHALLKLWEGGAVELGIDPSWLNELLNRLRQKVRVHEVEAVVRGKVPQAMLGWWVPRPLAAKFECEPLDSPH